VPFSKAACSASPGWTDFVVGFMGTLERYRTNYVNAVIVVVYEYHLVRRRGLLKRWGEEMAGWKFHLKIYALVLNKTNAVSYANLCAITEPSSYF
jgi:hypothetical protein